jgi:hypothetical protein
MIRSIRTKLSSMLKELEAIGRNMKEGGKPMQ